MKRRRSLLASLVLLLGACLPAHAAGPEWEELILDGVRRQDSRLREVSIDAVVRDQELLAARPSQGAAKVARLYLLGRAYGKRAELAPPEAATKDLDRARAVMREVLQAEPSCYFAHRDLGILALREAPPNVREAEASLQRALAAFPSYTQALRDLARLCSDQGRAADALVHLRRVIDLEPADMAARALLVMTLLDLKRVEEARRDVEAMLKARPTDVMARDLRAEVEMAGGSVDAALDVWRQLQAENPTLTKPLWGQWRALMAKGKAGQAVAREDMQQVVGRLYMLERDPAKRTRLKEMDAALRAPPPDPTQPPDDASLAKALVAPDAELRTKTLGYVAFREQAPGAELLRAVMSRLDPAREAVPAVRGGALVVLARHGGYGLLGLVRHALDDADPSVRRAALMAVEGMAQQGDAARRSGMLLLALRAADADAEVAAGARRAVWRLAQVVPQDGDADDASEAAAWRQWWSGAVGVDEKIKALGAYPQIRDLRADQVLVPFLDDADFFVMQAAYKALAASAAAIRDEAVRKWLESLPQWGEGGFTPERREEIVRNLAAWRALGPTGR